MTDLEKFKIAGDAVLAAADAALRDAYAAFNASAAALRAANKAYNAILAAQEKETDQ